MASTNSRKSTVVHDPVVNCTVVLKESEKYAYSSGEDIKGTLFVRHQKELVLHGFKIMLEGTAFTKVKNGDTMLNKTDKFLKIEHYVYGGKVIDGVTQKYRLSGGPSPHKYPIKITLPPNLPTPFRTSLGWIHYQLVVFMHTIDDRFLKKLEKPLQINSEIALYDPSLEPIVLEKTKHIASQLAHGGNPAGHYSFKFSIPKSGYLVGEDIPFQLELDNPKEYEVSNIRVSLIHRITFKGEEDVRMAEEKTMTAVLVVAEKKYIESSFGTIWTDNLKIPVLQAPSQEVALMSVHYVVKVEVYTVGPSGNLKDEVPILIGTTRVAGNPPTPPPPEPELEENDDYGELPVQIKSPSPAPVDFAGAAFDLYKRRCSQMY